ncbi:hypothetical protein [Idiomarina piscisalsi]|uniref:Antitoxin Xre/MbcA/ParS-like toxin-binding domain-containing protein n=1 Tax=Idiomarina piscisalsi TaxID=1096243 RepID=A0A432YHK9_9GAMM|nr:hypothetical protein [Idiomarina piscisalsi]RUO60395.1 hypothetical protein CWI73_12210 [Idiomarina piscisalsi]
MKQTESSQNIELNELLVSRIESTKIQEPNYSNLDLFLAFEKRIPGSILQKLVKSIPRELVMASLDLATEDYSKLVRRKTLTLKQTDNLYELTKIWAELRMLFNFDENSLNKWIDAELPILEGAKVRELIVTSTGRAALREIVSEMLSGDLT